MKVMPEAIGWVVGVLGVRLADCHELTLGHQSGGHARQGLEVRAQANLGGELGWTRRGQVTVCHHRCRRRRSCGCGCGEGGGCGLGGGGGDDSGGGRCERGSGGGRAAKESADGGGGRGDGGGGDTGVGSSRAAIVSVGSPQRVRCAAEVARGVEAVVQQIGVAAAEGSGANGDHAHPEGSEDDAEEHVGASAVLLEPLVADRLIGAAQRATLTHAGR
mmetsp:Transcript_35032/g.87665  ORF Transcript_35032/g.87665 Transcript_35032/m.87665 type:complete len:218 (+) Transcript_35032:404-1057(+)